MKSSQADNCHSFFFPAVILILNIIVLYPGCWVLISLHHIDEYKLLLTLSDVDSFSFYVFCSRTSSKGEAIAVKVLSLISSDIFVMMFFFAVSTTMTVEMVLSLFGVLIATRVIKIIFSCCL